MDQDLRTRLEALEAEMLELEGLLATEAVVSDPARLAELGRRHAELAAIVELFRRYREFELERSDAEELARSDPDMASEFDQIARRRAADLERLEREIHKALIPADPDDERPAIIEIRAAAGGDEAAIWAGDLLRMYERFAESNGLAVEVLEASPSESGGYSKVTAAVKGKGAYGRFRYEAGVHRVQRVPQTESQGRVHTSTATVAVLPEVEDVEVQLDLNDVRVDVFRSTGPGGQSVNTTDSAVRLTHLPTGLVVTCQDEKSQLQNKEKAFRILRARLYQAEEERRRSELAGERRSQVGTGERSEKIRTYNYKDNRVTDHRIGLTVKKLDRVLEGDLGDLVDAMAEHERTRRLTEV